MSYSSSSTDTEMVSDDGDSRLSPLPSRPSKSGPPSRDVDIVDGDQTQADSLSPPLDKPLRVRSGYIASEENEAATFSPRVKRRRKRVSGYRANVSSNNSDSEHERILPSMPLHYRESVPTVTVSEVERDSYNDSDSGLPLSHKLRTQLINRLHNLFKNEKEYRALLTCKGSDAQKLLDTFQQLLDLGYAQSSFHRDLIVATQRLAGASGLYPKSYELKNVTVSKLPQRCGGFGDIYKGELCGHAVCLKTIRLYESTQISHFEKVVSKEAVLWGQLRHPNLLPFYGICHFNGRISLVAPWMENGNVVEYLKHHVYQNRVVLTEDVAHGLEFLHKNGIIHGDLKGASLSLIIDWVTRSAYCCQQTNILVNKFGRACLGDFGLSSISDKEILAWTSYSSAASKGGTVRWQAPELFDPDGDEEKRNTEASDIYAWACVAYEIFTGQVPFSHLTREATIIKQVSNGERPARPPKTDLSWSTWGLTEQIWALMETCWSAQPEGRPTIQAVIARLLSTGLMFGSLGPRFQRNGSLPSTVFRSMMRRTSDSGQMSVDDLETLLGLLKPEM